MAATLETEPYSKAQLYQEMCDMWNDRDVYGGYNRKINMDVSTHKPGHVWHTQ